MFCIYLFEDIACIFFVCCGVEKSTTVCKHIHELLKRAAGMSKILIGTSVLEFQVVLPIEPDQPDPKSG